MSVSITIQAGDNSRFAPEIARLPSEFEVGRPAGSLLRLLAMPVLLFFLYSLLAALMPSLSTGLVLAAALVMALAGWAWWRQNGRPHVIWLGPDGVDVIERRTFSSHRWQARYADFDCVMLQTLAAASPGGRTSYAIIELRHPDPRRTLPLYAVRSQQAPREHWQALARLFHLPTCNGHGVD